MCKNKQNYFDEKKLIEVLVERKISKHSIINDELLARLDYDLVECSNVDDERIISNILYQNTVLRYTGKIYYLPSLLKDIEKIEQGFKFERIQLSDEEYADLRDIVNRLKQFINDNEID